MLVAIDWWLEELFHYQKWQLFDINSMSLCVVCHRLSFVVSVLWQNGWGQNRAISTRDKYFNLITVRLTLKFIGILSIGNQDRVRWLRYDYYKFFRHNNCYNFKLYKSNYTCRSRAVFFTEVNMWYIMKISRHLTNLIMLWYAVHLLKTALTT